MKKSVYEDNYKPSNYSIIIEVMVLRKKAVLLGIVFLLLESSFFAGDIGKICSHKENPFFLKNNGQDIARTLIKNDTAETISYSIILLSPGEESRKKLINPGEIHYYPGYFALKITFSRNSRELIYRLNPGNVYAFKQDRQGKLDVFVSSEVRADYESSVPFVTTPSDIVREMLRVSEVKPEDIVYDLGSGDGRIIITAAREFGAGGIGVDIDPELVKLSKKRALQAGVSDKVEFKVEDVFKTDISKATVVTLYMLGEVNENLRCYLDDNLQNGGRVVTHNYPIPGWAANLIDTVSLRSEEDGEEHIIYLYQKY
ncbi:MAG: SAM-dependent methyltransferase [Acidobacteriota bacterium]